MLLVRISPNDSTQRKVARSKIPAPFSAMLNVLNVGRALVI